MTQRDTAGTLRYLSEQRASGTTQWKQLCQKLARSARNIPAMFPSALSSAQGTPERYRVRNVADLKKGMVAYFDDPNDSNPFGHIVTVHGRDANGNVLVWSNMADGTVKLVQFDWFRKNWGDSFQFGATWLNGVELNLPKPPAPPARPITTGGHIKAAIESLDKAIAYHHAKGHARLVAALQRDRNDLKATLKNFS